MLKTFVAMGSLNMFLAVALGAFGAHVLKERISSDMLSIYQTGVHYHMIHAIGLLMIALLSSKMGNLQWIHWSGWLLQIGILLFSGSLYTLSITGVRVLGIVTPFGGLCFLAGWALLALAAWRLA